MLTENGECTINNYIEEIPEINETIPNSEPKEEEPEFFQCTMLLYPQIYFD